MGEGEPAVQRAFLFTDIEGSTRLWERYPRVMPAALAHHDALLQTAFGTYHGRIFKTIGDAVCAVFTDSASAALAAVAAQRALAAASWVGLGLPEPLSVRMAIHAGPVREQADDFAGPVLNRLSRLLAAGHGGQILLAGVVADQVAGDLPAGVELRDLGQRRLRDVPGTERVCQLSIDGLASTFPPLKTLDSIAHNLPIAPTPCIGRETERAQLRALFPRSDMRLATLLGPGGIGKTRLALQAATDLLDEFPDGVWFVDLTPVREAGLVAGTVIRALGIREEAGRTTEDALLVWLRERELLLVLDNCEQVIEGASHLAAAVLREASRVRVLATSRAPLSVRGEQRLPVEPLALPREEQQPLLLHIKETASVQLFVARASAARPSFALSAANAPHVAEICRRVDGIPLALELAAARITVLSPEALRDRLDHRLPTLSSGARDLPERHQTLRNAIAWSYDLLPEREQAVFRRLSVFAGGWTFQAASEVLGDEPGVDLLEVLESLTAQSLIRVEPEQGQIPRFTMLETIREFALERLADAGEEGHLRAAHSDRFLAFAEEVGPYLLEGDRQLASFRQVDADYANIVAALAWGEATKDSASMLRLCVAIWNYWSKRGPTTDGKHWIQRALDLENNVDPTILIDALNRLGNICIDMGQVREAAEFYNKSLHLAMRHRYRFMIARNLCSLGMVANLQGGSDNEFRLIERGLRISSELNDLRGIALATLNLAISCRDAEHFERSRTLHDQAIVHLRSLGDEDGVAGARCYLGILLIDTGQIDQAEEAFNQALTTFELVGDAPGIAQATYGLGLVDIERGELVRARQSVGDALHLNRSGNQLPAMAECLEALAMIFAAMGEFERAAASIGASRRLRDLCNVASRRSHRPQLERLVRQLEEAMGAAAFDAAASSGSAASALDRLTIPDAFRLSSQNLHTGDRQPIARGAFQWPNGM